jgi:hypothetical protein
VSENITLLTFLIVFSLKLYANDYYFYYLSGGSIVPAENNNTNVEMIEETIYLELFDYYYKVSVDFIFFNNGIEEELLVGFPYLSERIDMVWEIVAYIILKLGLMMN